MKKSNRPASPVDAEAAPDPDALELLKIVKDESQQLATQISKLRHVLDIAEIQQNLRSAQHAKLKQSYEEFIRSSGPFISEIKSIADDKKPAIFIHRINQYKSNFGRLVIDLFIAQPAIFSEAQMQTMVREQPVIQLAIAQEAKKRADDPGPLGNLILHNPQYLAIVTELERAKQAQAASGAPVPAPAPSRPGSPVPEKSAKNGSRFQFSLSLSPPGSSLASFSFTLPERADQAPPGGEGNQAPPGEPVASFSWPKSSS